MHEFPMTSQLEARFLIVTRHTKDADKAEPMWLHKKAGKQTESTEVKS